MMFDNVDYNFTFLDKIQEQDLSTPLLEYLAKQNDRQRVRVNHKDERRKKVFIRKQEKEEVWRNKKVEKEIFIKPKPITKSNIISKRVIDDKPVKDTSQKYADLILNLNYFLYWIKIFARNFYFSRDIE